CDEYCSTPENMEVCMNFAMEAGFMSEQEKADSQKMLQALKKGIKPPNCKGKEACDEYCSTPENMEVCMNFAIEAGFMTAEDAAMARKTGGKGPGGCKGKEECEAFCNNPDNQETCFNFGRENGLIPEEDLRQMEQGKQQLQQSLQQAPQVVMDCLQSALGPDAVEKMKSGTGMPSRDVGDKMQECFQQMGPPPGEGQSGSSEGGNISPGGQTGPGGCANEEECQKYCESNPEQCQGSQPQNQPMQGGGGSGYAPIPCEGENCSIPPQDGQQYQPPQPGQDTSPQSPPSTAPEGGGSAEPAPPIEQQPPASGLDPYNLLGAVENILREFFGK
ncbi:MAG: hypothetical protein AAB577_01465, partial [Patescibacteria group bacterium]